MEKPESGIRNRSRKRNRNRNQNLNWDQGKLGNTETSYRYPCGNKIQDGVLCYHCFEKFSAQWSWYQRNTHRAKELTFVYLVHACVLLYQTCLHITLRHFYQKKNKQTNKQNIQLWLNKKKNITTKIQRISPCCSAADSSINSRHNNFTFSHVLTFQSIRRFVAICKRKQICFCKMVTFFGNIVYSYSYLLLKGLRVSSIVRERRQREE